MRAIRKSFIAIAKKNIKDFDPAAFEMAEWFDLYWYKFDLFVAEDCDHFISTEDNPYMETMMKI